MQRLGFLKHLVARASQTSTSNLRALGDNLIKTVSSKVSVSATPSLEKYLSAILSGISHQALMSRVRNALEQSTVGGTVSVELQDAYLSSDTLPSRRGRLVPYDWQKYPHLAVRLGLLRENSFSPLVRGQVFLALVSPAELAAFREYSENTNPFILTVEQRIFFLFTFLERDEHVLLPLYRALLPLETEFTEWEAGNLMPKIFGEIYQSFRPIARSGADTVRLQSLLETAKVIERWRDKRYSGKGARDDAATLRVEPFVDIGILTKEDPFSYRYHFTPTGRQLMSALTKAEKGEPGLDSGFFASVSEAFNLSAPPIQDPDKLLDLIYPSFVKLASPLGYAPMREVILLAAISATTTGRGCFELADGYEALKDAQREYPELVRFNVDRWGNPIFVKFLSDPVRS